MNKCTIAILISNSVLCAGGVIMVLVSCIQYNLWWPLLTIAMHGLAVVFPSCNCSSNDENSVAGQVAWLFVGLFVTFGYAIPSILYRGGLMPEIGLILTLCGGTVILVSILIFVRTVYYTKDPNKAYVF